MCIFWGGRVILVDGLYHADRNLHDREMRDNADDGNSPVDMLFWSRPNPVVRRPSGPARSVLSVVFEQWRIVLQQIREQHLKGAGRPARESCGMTPGFDSVPAASKPTNRTPGSSMNAWKMPIALEPPPTHAVTASGSLPAWLTI